MGSTSRWGSWARTRLAAALAGAALISALVTVPATSAPASRFSRDIRFVTPDGVSLKTTLSGWGGVAARPLIVEFSPYGDASGTFDPSPAYNSLLVQIRGTGDSDGQFDALGPQTQKDVYDVLKWACHQPWSNGKLGLNGFSASAITVYNSLHRPLPCVLTAVLKSGTFELYRDLLWPGGVSNAVPGIGVAGLIGAPAARQSDERLARNPASAPLAAAGLIGASVAAGLQHPTLDSWWVDRGFTGDAKPVPTLMVDGFFDVESRGAFQAFQALRPYGAHLLVIGAHDGSPKGTGGGVAETQAWFDHYLTGADNGVDRRPAVQLWLSHGDRLGYLNGDFVRYDASSWPVPGTVWIPFSLSAARSGTARSLNDGTLTRGSPGPPTLQSYPNLASPPSMSDVPNAAILGGDGLNALAAAVPPFEQMNVAEADALSYTSAPISAPLMAAGPLDLDIPLSSTAGETGIWAVISDVWPDGSAHPLTVGRLLDDYPNIDASRSLYYHGRLVQPYGVYDRQTPPAPLQARMYHVEFWPIGNRFETGHRLRLDIVGLSGASKPGPPGLNTIRVGAGSGAVLEVPSLPAHP